MKILGEAERKLTVLHKVDKNLIIEPAIKEICVGGDKNYKTIYKGAFQMPLCGFFPQREGGELSH